MVVLLFSILTLVMTEKIAVNLQEQLLVQHLFHYPCEIIYF